MEIDPCETAWQSLYRIMLGTIVPRPIGWISTIDEEGHANLAPFSFFNAVCANPPHVLFCPSIRSIDQKPKDTFNNVRATGEFVVNIVTEELGSAMNTTSTDLPAGVDEFALAGLTPLPSIRVRPPRVAESPVQFECQVVHIVELGNEPGTGSVVIGRVMYFHVADEVIYDGDKIDIRKLKPIGRLAGNSYCYVRDIFELVRPAPQIAI